MNKYALQLKNIKKSYKDGDQEQLVIKNISLDIHVGEFVAIVGPSGSGKSTLLSIAGALLSATSGEVYIGENLVPNDQKKWTEIRQKQIGFIFQSHNLVPYLNVVDQLKLISVIEKKKLATTDNYIDELLESLDLTKRKKHFPHQLSGGEKQRVAIARAFMNNPDIILADEPTASLDSKRGRQVVELIKEETKKFNKSAIIVTHDERILDLVDTIYEMEDGTIKKII